MSIWAPNFLQKILANANVKASPLGPLKAQEEIKNTLHDIGENGKVNVNMRISVVQAMNGVVLEILRYRHNPSGSDWYATHYIVQEEQKLSDAIAMCLLMKD